MSGHIEHEEGFIPKFLLEELAEKGNEDAKRTLAGMAELAKKEEQVKKTEGQAVNNALEASHNPKCVVYDSQGTGQLRYKLSRKEGDALHSDQAVNLTFDFSSLTGIPSTMRGWMLYAMFTLRKNIITRSGYPTRISLLSVTETENGS